MPEGPACVKTPTNIFQIHQNHMLIQCHARSYSSNVACTQWKWDTYTSGIHTRPLSLIDNWIQPQTYITSGFLFFNFPAERLIV